MNNDKYTLSQSINDLIGIICQQRQGTYNSGLWFLTCLFVIEILLYFIINISKNKTHVITVSILVMFLIGVGFSKSTGFLLAWELDVAFISIIFVGTGYLFRNVQSVILERGSLILCVMLLFVNAMTTYLNFNISGKAVDLAVNIIGNPILFLISAYSGIFFLIFLFRNSTKFNILKYIGKNSLVFYGLSDLMMFLPDIVIYNILHIDIPAMGNASVIIGIFYAITVNLIIWPLCWIINKKFSFVLGKF